MAIENNGQLLHCVTHTCCMPTAEKPFFYAFSIPVIFCTYFFSLQWIEGIFKLCAVHIVICVHYQQSFVILKFIDMKQFIGFWYGKYIRLAICKWRVEEHFVEPIEWLQSHLKPLISDDMLIQGLFSSISHSNFISNKLNNRFTFFRHNFENSLKNCELILFYL